MDPELPLSKSPILVPEYPPSVLGWDNDPNAAYWPILTSVPLTPGIDGLNLNSGVRVPAISTVAAPGSTAEVAATTVVVLAFPTLDEGSGSVRDRRRHGTGNDDDGTALVPGMLLFSHPADRAADNVTFMVTTVLDLRSYAHSTMQPAATRLRMQMSLSVSGMDVARSVHHERVVSRVDGHNETQLVAFRVADTTWTVACTPLESFVSQYFGGAPVVASHLASAAALVVAWLAYRAMDRMLALWKVESLLDAWRVSAEAVLAALPNPMILINKAGDIQGVNGPLLDLTGRSAVTEIASLDALVRVVATQCKDGTDALHTPPEDPSKTPHASVLNQVPQPPGISGTTASVQPSTSPSSSLTATLLGLSATRPSALTMSGALPAAATNTTMAAAAPSCELPRPAAPTCHQQQQAKPHFVHRYPSPALVRPSSTYPTPPEAARLDVHLVCAAPRTTIEMTAGVAPTPGHPHVSHVVVLTDVSEMRVRDRTLAATVRESARLHASQHHLLLYLAHELRNPLYVVQGWADDERSRIDHGDSDADGGVGAWKQLVLVESMIGSTVALLDGVVGAMHGAWVSESGQIAPRPHPSSVSPLPPPATTRSAASSHGHFSPSALPATFPYLRTDSIQSAPLAAEPRLGSPAVSPITDLSAFVAPPLAPSPPLLRPARQYLNPWRVVAR
ncbi:hypothetical protein BC828DRAFT_376683 [Blastocladiella britannica]|nr:hypothetical protein BC828DRAFT_376683 [Blastocladiella britannica]